MHPHASVAKSVIGGGVESEFENVEGEGFIQTYCVMQSKDNSSPHMKVIYVRLGDHVYHGSMMFPTNFGISDFVDEIPSMRQQQDRLKFLAPTSKLSVDSEFARPMRAMMEKSKEILRMIALADSTLEMLVSFGSKLCGSTDGGNGQNQNLPWLDDARASFFEFCTNGQDSLMRNVDMMAYKVYLTDMILVTMYHGSTKTFFATLQDATENDGSHPLFDTSFPDLSQRKRGATLGSYPTGTKTWPQLRSMVLWQVPAAVHPSHSCNLPLDREDGKVSEESPPRVNKSANKSARKGKPPGPCWVPQHLPPLQGYVPHRTMSGNSMGQLPRPPWDSQGKPL